MPQRKRNYTRERKQETPERKQERLARGRARYKLMKEGKVKVGDGKVVGHKKRMKAGGSKTARNNLRVETQKASNKQGGRMRHGKSK